MTIDHLTFDAAAFEALDQFALLADQDYNLGDNDRWFLTFRGGLYGFYARLHAVRTHYKLVHAWLPAPRHPMITEYHLTSIIFGMDSAIECFTFALNALGFAVRPSEFSDISTPQGLKKIRPGNITGNPPAALLRGYAKVFPTVQQLWAREAALIGRITDLHDVSKHRQTIYDGGRARNDPPDGFYESLRIGEDPSDRADFWPSAEIILRRDPKAPASAGTAQPVDPGDLLENLAPDFVSFIEATAKGALSDARANIPLNETVLRR